MKKLLTLFSLISMSAFSIVAPSGTKQLMHEALDSIIHLIPYMSSDMKFKDPDNGQTISLHLNKISNAFKNATHVNELESVGFSPNFKVIKEHLAETIDTFNHNNKDFARLRLQATTSICMSCHTQIPKDRVTSFIIQSSKTNRDNFQNEFEYANFKFLIRDYKGAINAYKQSIERRIEKRKDNIKIKEILGNNYEYFDKTLFNSFKQVLVILTKIERSPDNAINFFTPYIKSKNVPPYIKDDLQNWVKQLRAWKQNSDIKLKFTSDNEIKKFIKKHEQKLHDANSSIKTGEYDIDLLIISGILSNFLHTQQNTSLAPKILYWIGLSENRLNNNLFFTLGDLYLKECITKYPTSSIAKKCYQEYENEIEFRFTGSMGTKIPKSQKLELQKLKKLIKL